MADDPRAPVVPGCTGPDAGAARPVRHPQYQGRALVPLPIPGTEELATSWPERAREALAASTPPLGGDELQRVVDDLTAAAGHLDRALTTLAPMPDARTDDEATSREDPCGKDAPQP